MINKDLFKPLESRATAQLPLAQLQIVGLHPAHNLISIAACSACCKQAQVVIIETN